MSAEEIYSSSYAAAAYLESIGFPKDKKVYVVGEVGIQQELDKVGIHHIGGPADADRKVDLSPGTYMEHDADVAAVIVGACVSFFGSQERHLLLLLVRPAIALRLPGGATCVRGGSILLATPAS